MNGRRSTNAHATPPATSKPRPAVPVRAQRILGLLAFGTVAAACVRLGVIPVFACIEAIESGAPLVTLYPRDAVIIPLCIAFVLFAAMCALPDLQIRLRPSRRSATARRADRMATVLFAGVGLSMLAVPFASLVASVGVEWLAADRGYIACPAPVSNRYGAMRWASDAPTCPKG